DKAYRKPNTSTKPANTHMVSPPMAWSEMAVMPGIAWPQRAKMGQRSDPENVMTAPTMIGDTMVMMGHKTRPVGKSTVGGLDRRSRIRFQYMNPLITTDQFMSRYKRQSSME